MRMTFTDLQNQHLRNIGQQGSTDAQLLADFQLNLGSRYQLVLARLRDYMTQKTATTQTVAAQQYYHYPVGVENIEAVFITIGQVKYPMTTVNSQWQWNWLNALQVQPTAIPQFMFPRQSDFGIYPIPQDIHTLTFDYHYRDRDLSIQDYTTGTVTVSLNSQTVTGLGTTFTPAMVGRWFQVTDPTAPGQGYFYRIFAVPNTTTLTLETAWEGADGATLTYRVGETPEFPEEGHIILADGTASDFYAGIRNDIQSATWWNNKFYTGDGQNSRRDYGDSTISGGLIGLYNQYTDRNTERVIDRNKHIYPFLDQIWGMRLS